MKKIILSALFLMVFSATFTFVFASEPFIRNNTSTAKTGVSIHRDVPILQIDIENVSIVTASSIVFDIDDILGYKLDFKISGIKYGSAPTTANVSYRSKLGTQYETATLTAATPITNVKSAYVRITIPMLNTRNVTVTGNLRVYQ
jgi:hypothetical protein